MCLFWLIFVPKRYIPVAPYLLLIAASLSVGYWVGSKSRINSAISTKARPHDGPGTSSGDKNETESMEGSLHSLPPAIDQTEECKMVKPNGKILCSSAHPRTGFCRTNGLGNVFRKNRRAVRIMYAIVWCMNNWYLARPWRCSWDTQ